MEEFIGIFYKNRNTIESFLKNSIGNTANLLELEKEKFEYIFSTFPALNQVYIVNDKYKQISASYYENDKDDNKNGMDREHILQRVSKTDSNFMFTDIYKSALSKKLCITVVKIEGDKTILMDFDVAILFDRLGLIDRNIVFTKIQKLFYGVAGFFMMALAMFAIVYAGINLASHFIDMTISIETIFKPVITVTLGLAIFDLGKTVLEQEFFYKKYKNSEANEIKILTKFLFTVLIALSIEILMIVFKTAMQKGGDMLNAFYLMGGISFMLISLSLFIYLTNKHQE